MISNIFADIPERSERELFETLYAGQAVRIERIVSTGQRSAEGFWYDQEEDEFVLLLKGQAVLGFENEEVSLKKGDWLLISAHRKHRVVATDPDGPTVWLAVFVKSDHA